MAHRPRKSCRWLIALTEALLLGALGSAALAATPRPADSADGVAFSAALTADAANAMSTIGGTDLYLDVTLNGASSGLAHFGYRDGELWASTATLHGLGFVLPARTPDPLRLNSMQGVQAHYDAQQQSVSINAPLRLLRLSNTILNARTSKAPRATTSPGLLLNYDLYGMQGERGATSLSGFTELRAFNNAGVLSSTALSQLSSGSGLGVRNRSVRLDTTWSTSFPDELLTLRLGDTLTSASSWSRSTRIAGVQLSRNFALQPYLLTLPLPSFAGSATLPSQVDLYINGMRQYSGNVPAGPFQLNTSPSITGAGNAQVIVTDALGRVTTLDFSLYNAPQLLQQGLSDWSAEVGVVRQGYGLRSFDYGHEPAGSGTWRYGVTNNFTAEAHGEATDRLTNAGAGGVWLLGTAGVVSGSVARSQSGSESGSQLGVGYNWSDNRFNFALNGTRTTSGYRDIAALNGAPAPRVSASAQAGYNTLHLGSFGVSYVHLRYPQQEASRYGSAYWFKSLERSLSLNVNVNQNLDKSRDRSIFLGVSFALDDNISVSTGMQHSNGSDSYTTSASSPVPSQGGFGWNAQLQQSNSRRGGQAELDFLGRYGRVDAGVSSFGGNNFAYAGANGAIVLMGGDVFASQQIANGFAVVSTDGIAHVPVQLENRPIGTTDKQGLLLVTPLNSYQSNQLSIDPMDLPADVRIDRVEAIATPTDRAGTMVRFGITPIRAASIILVDVAGKPIPLGSQVFVNNLSGEPAMVGYDGAVYLDTLDNHNVLRVTTPSGVCHAKFDYHKQGTSVPQIGPLNCITEVSP